MRNRSLFLIILAAIPLILQHAHSQEKNKLTVLTSFFPIHAHTLAITGNLANVIQILPPNSSPHDYELKPSDLVNITNADLVIINGAGLESWLQKIVKNVNPKIQILDTSTNLPLLPNPQPTHNLEDQNEHTHNHPSSQAIPTQEKINSLHENSHHHHSHKNCCHSAQSLNPHFWLDPVLAKAQAQSILDALCKADPQNAQSYQANAASYFQKLDQLHADFQKTLAQLPNKNLVTFHSAFTYLASRYGLNYVGFIEKCPEANPSPKQLADLINTIRKLSIGVIFADKNYSPPFMEKIARETNTKLSFLDTLEFGVASPNAYIERMQANLQILRNSLSPQP
ncbi:MAG: zinc ABC transporter substrate-binding protein [Chthoniobacterales bacterium]|nr:zinc ABC transporter substrate-binding protein [Chthoniobacterales bacterium]